VALFGDFGKAVGRLLPVNNPVTFIPGALVRVWAGATQIATGKIGEGLGTIDEVKRGAGQQLGLVRSIIGLQSVGAQERGPDNRFPQQEERQQPDYFQPTQFSGGSYDPALGGGFPAEINYGGYDQWDYSTFSTQQPTTSWGGYSAEMTDWAADW